MILILEIFLHRIGGLRLPSAQEVWKDLESFPLVGREDGVVLDEFKGNVEAVVDVVVVCVSPRRQLEVLAGSTA